MKNIRLLIVAACLSGSLCFGQTNTTERRIWLAGFSNFNGPTAVLLEVKPAGTSRVEQFTLTEGERNGVTEVVRIDREKGIVDIVDDGRKLSLKFEPHIPTVSGKTHGFLELQNVELQQVLKIYASYKGRTLLTHPRLVEVGRMSVTAKSAGNEEVISAVEKAFQEQGIAVVPDGDKFVMLVPAALTNAVAPRSREVAGMSEDRGRDKDQVVPAGMVDFRKAPLMQVLQFYAELQGRKLVVNGKFPNQFFDFWTQTPLTKAEVLYAFDTLFTWSRIGRTLGDDGTVKVEMMRR